MKLAPAQIRLAVLPILLGCALLSGVGRVGSPSVAEVSIEGVGAIMPRVSPDGSRVAFSYQGAIWVVPREGGTMRRVTSTGNFDCFPAWSPDGKRIAFVDNWHTGRLRIVDPETGAFRAHKVTARMSGKIRFHPDGTRILFHENQRNGYVLSWVDVKTGKVRNLGRPERRLPAFALSSDGSRIVRASHQDKPGEQGGHDGPQADLWVRSADGGEPGKLTRTRSRVFHLWWHGNQVIYSSDQGGAHNNLWALSVSDPGKADKLTNNLADQDEPSISKDGRWLVYADNSGSATGIVVRDRVREVSRMIHITGMDFGTETGTIRIRTSDKASMKPVIARISIKREGGKYHAPPGALYRMDGGLVHFYCPESAEFAVPAGKYVVRGFRGMEYREFRTDVEVKAGAATEVPVPMERWINPEEMEIYSGESHIHANYGYGHWYNTPETMKRQVVGEGLNVANFVVANSDTDGIFDREFWRGGPDPVSTERHVLYWNEEFRATLWGHMTLYNLKQLVEPIMTGFKDTTNPYDHIMNADIADMAHLQGGHVNYTHPMNNKDPFLHAYSAKEIPVDVALGKIDSLDINASFRDTVPLWYRLLNCGFRLPASAGTDCFLNRIRSRKPGQDRAYVPVKGAFTYGKWVKGLAEGRSFVTNGPWLELVADGKKLGDTIEIGGPSEIPVMGVAMFDAPLDRLELVYNGKVVATGKLSPEKKVAHIAEKVELGRPGWLSLRAYAKGYAQAHTSPIYVTVDGKGASSAEDAKYFLEWIDRLEAKMRERNRVPGRKMMDHVMGILNEARAIYRKMADEN